MADGAGAQKVVNSEVGQFHVTEKDNELPKQLFVEALPHSLVSHILPQVCSVRFAFRLSGHYLGRLVRGYGVLVRSTGRHGVEGIDDPQDTR